VRWAMDRITPKAFVAGFDLTDISAEAWEILVNSLQLEYVHDIVEGYHVWVGNGVEIRTGNCPVTGVYGCVGKRELKVGYASYIGIYCIDEQDRDFIFEYIEKNASFIKEFTSQESRYI
jgi:hypothetical protein